MALFRRSKPEKVTPPWLVPVPGSEGHSFCEATTATGVSRWHIRKLGPEGHKLTGGVKTTSLCGHVRPFPEGCGGWDLEVPLSEHHLGHACSTCVQEFRSRTSGEK